MSRRRSRASCTMECTKDCSLVAHSNTVLSVAYQGQLRLFQCCCNLCANYVHIRDELGRNALHIAASRGHLTLVQWLLERKARIHSADLESHWTALHRSAYYGWLGACAMLVKAGADLSVRDNDGLTALSIVNSDRDLLRGSLSVGGVSVYTWGSNVNTTLGHDLSCTHPQRLELSDTLNIIQVVLCKFHTVLLSQCGSVLTCGHGLGGRLGHGNEASLVVPCVVRGVEGVAVGVTAARNHTVIVTQSGGVYSWGLNDAHQLGLGPTAPPTTLLPRYVKSMKHKSVIGVGAGRYHTALITLTELYTVGKNLGQLGFEKSHSSLPSLRAVPGVSVESGDVISQLSASDAATAILTKRGRVFVCTAYTVKSIRCGPLDNVPCRQFSVCASLSDMDHLRKIETEPPKLLFLTDSYNLLSWQPTVVGSTPSLLSGLTRLKVTHFSLGRSLTVVTTEGEVYSGMASLSKGPLSLSRHPGLQNSCSVFTDFKSTNYSVTQEVYRSPSLPDVPSGTLSYDLSALLDSPADTLSDLVIETEGGTFPCHRLFIGNVSREAKQLLSVCSDTLPLTSSAPTLTLALLHTLYGDHLLLLPPSQPRPLPDLLPNGGSSEEVTPDTSFNVDDDNDLTAMYDAFTQPRSRGQSEEPPLAVSTPKKRGVPSSRQCECVSSATWSVQLTNVTHDITVLLTLATHLHHHHLQSRLEELLQNTTLLEGPYLLQSHSPALSPTSLYSDLSLVSREGVCLPCHRCVLVSRSHYFKSMFLYGWRESSVDSVTLPMSEIVLRALLEYLYTDACSSLQESADISVGVLIIADQLILPRLLALCEVNLASSLSMKNVVERLELADRHNALQLKQYCLQFICINASALLESRVLDRLELSLLESLSLCYRDMVPSVIRRLIQLPEPSLDWLLEENFEEEEDTGSKVTEQPLPPEQQSSGGRKRRRRKVSQTEGGHYRRPPTPQSPNKTTTYHPGSSPEPTNEIAPDQSSNEITPQSEIASRQSSSKKFFKKITPRLSNQITPQRSSNETTPQQSSNETTSRSSARVSRDSRTKLTTRFNETKTVAWGRSLSSSGSLRDIMAQEQALLTTPTKAVLTTPTRGRGKRPVEPPMGPAPSTDTAPSSNANPWGGCERSSSPSVSLRELMAEAEVQSLRSKSERALKVQQHQSGKIPPPLKVPPVKPAMSFAAIVHSQEVEHSQQQQRTVGQSLRSIQIEERAISELLEEYGAVDNPDEYITVTPLTHSHTHSHTHQWNYVTR